MLSTQRHQYTLMQNMHQKSPGRSRLMTSSREFQFSKLKSYLRLCSFISLFTCIYKLIHAFIRYADRVNAYWTGYFTSRPALKGYVRAMSAYYLVNSLAILVYTQ